MIEIIHLTVGFPNLKDQSMRIKHLETVFVDDSSKCCFMVVLLTLLCRTRHKNKIRQFVPLREEGFWDECGFQTLISDRVLNLEKMSPHSWSHISIIPFQQVLSHTDVCTGQHYSILFVVLINCMLRSPCFDRNHEGLLLFDCFCTGFS